MTNNQISRRAFLWTVLTAISAGAVLDKDRLLWVPGEKVISVPMQIDLVAVNLEVSRRIGMFHDGLSNPYTDIISCVPFSTLPAPVREHWEHINGRRWFYSPEPTGKFHVRGVRTA